MSELWKNPTLPGMPGAGPGIIPGGRRSPSPLADYQQARFTGYGGSDVHQEVPEPPPAALNPILGRLRDDLVQLAEAHRDFFARNAETDTRTLTRTRQGWAVTWRRWALDDLGDRVAETRGVFVIYRGDSFHHRLFLDKNGRQLLAVQPREPLSPLRYRKLNMTTDLCDLYGPFARLADSPLG